MSQDRGSPDYKAASFALVIASTVSFLKRAGIDYEVAERCALLADEVYQAIAIRGARVGELVEAVRSVRAGGSILDDLPTVRAKPPMEPPK